MIDRKKLIIFAAIAILAAASLAYVFASQLPLSFHGVGVLKSADRFAYIGDMVTYQIKVYNPSNYDLHNVNVSDTLLGFNTTIDFMAAANETGVTYTLFREVLDTDPNPLVNTVVVEAIDSDGVYSTASTQAITIIAERVIDISKVGPETAYADTDIVYMIMVNNTGDMALHNVTVDDDMLGFSWHGDLNSGESNVFNLTHRIPCDAEGNYTNTVVAWATLNETTYYAEAAWTTKILSLCPRKPRSMGYWKNHAGDWPSEGLEIGNVTYTHGEALDVLREASAKDATRMLAAQLIAAKLNRLSNVSSSYEYMNKTMNIDETIAEADSYLMEHPIGSDPEGDYRITALQLKDMLDAYNNSEYD